MPELYRVFVVVDREYGERLGELAQTGPVWIVDTPANRTNADQRERDLAIARARR